MLYHRIIREKDSRKVAGAKNRRVMTTFVEGRMCDEDAHKFFTSFCCGKTARSKLFVNNFLLRNGRSESERENARERKRERNNKSSSGWVSGETETETFFQPNITLKKGKNFLNMNEKSFWVTTEKNIKVKKAKLEAR